MTKAFLKKLINITKGVLTSIMGVVTYIATIMLLVSGTIDFVWSGAVGLLMGTVLLLAPDTLVKQIGKIIGSVGLNKGGASNSVDEAQTKDTI